MCSSIIMFKNIHRGFLSVKRFYARAIKKEKKRKRKTNIGMRKQRCFYFDYEFIGSMLLGKIFIILSFKMNRQFVIFIFLFVIL